MDGVGGKGILGKGNSICKDSVVERSTLFRRIKNGSNAGIVVFRGWSEDP